MLRLHLNMIVQSLRKKMDVLLVGDIHDNAPSVELAMGNGSHGSVTGDLLGRSTKGLPGQINQVPCPHKFEQRKSHHRRLEDGSHAQGNGSPNNSRLCHRTHFLYLLSKPG